MLLMLKSLKFLRSINHKAFSLFELTITISALFVFIFFTIPKLSFVSDFVLKRELDRLFTTFSYLQEKAIASNKDQYLMFNLCRNSYYFIDRNQRKRVILLPEIIKFGFLPNALGPPSNPKKKIRKAISFKKSDKNKFIVTFSSDGNISSGSIYLVDKDNTRLVALSSSVSPFSCIRTYRYKSKKWISLK